MRFSYNWLREFLPLDASPDDLAKGLLLLGFEVSSMQRLGPGFEGVIVGKITSVDKHPNADRLSLCRVTVGGDDLSIVCGAKNVVAGALVPVARIGAKLPGGRSIERAKIRGVESQGMICSASELGLASADANGGIWILPPQTPVGEDAAKLIGEADFAMEVEITPNRPDCLSHLGLARELSVHLGKDIKFSRPPLASHSPSALQREVRLESPSSCRRYLGREFSGLQVGPSPGWMAQRLEAVGLRPINNLVDITNYVLFEMGHPLHIFDSEKLKGAISVRFAKAGEKLRALDRQDYALGASNLVIADTSGPVAIAGVIGGEPTSVTEKTTSGFLESACFNAATVRRSAKQLKIRTDASFRFERGTDPESAALASARASQLILQLCSKASAGEWTDAYPEPPESKVIEVSSGQINRILGTDHPSTKIEDILRRMAVKIEPAKPSGMVFTVPSNRLDLETAPDLAEEVGRHLGYDSIPAKAGPVVLETAPADPWHAWIISLRRKLEARGFFEAYNYDFLSKAQLTACGIDPGNAATVELLNPLSEEWGLLRPTLLPGLLQNAVYNLSRGAQNLRLFETGHVYSQAAHDVSEPFYIAGILIGDWPPEAHWREKPRHSDYYDAKGVVEDLVPRHPSIQWTPLEHSDQQSAGIALFHPKAAVQLRSPKGCLGTFGLLHPKVLMAWDIQRPAAAFELDLSALGVPQKGMTLKLASSFPSSSRDISIVVDESVPFEKVRSLASDLENLYRLDLIDVYAGKGIPAGKKSLTLRLNFVRNDRTLKDEEVEAAVAKALAALKQACGAELRA